MVYPRHDPSSRPISAQEPAESMKTEIKYMIAAEIHPSSKALQKVILTNTKIKSIGVTELYNLSRHYCC